MTAPTNPDPSPFADHVIVHEYVDGTFGTWQCKRPSPGANPDGFTNNYWFRVTADRGVLTVTGDFYPTTFTLGPADPVSCVHWMGSRKPGDSYFSEKARNGSGPDAVTSYDTDAARDDLRLLLAHAQADGETQQWQDALQAGIDTYAEDGRVGVHEICEAVMEAIEWDGDMASALAGVGQRLASHVTLAAQALQHLTRLLESPAP